MSTALPIYPVYNDDKTWFTGGANPVRRLNETLWRNTDNRIIGGLILDYEVIKDLNIRVNGSYDYLSGIDDQWESGNWINDTQKPGLAKRSPYRGKNWVASEPQPTTGLIKMTTVLPSWQVSNSRKRVLSTGCM